MFAIVRFAGRAFGRVSGRLVEIAAGVLDFVSLKICVDDPPGQAALAVGKPRRLGRRFPRPGKRIGPLEAVDLVRAVVLDFNEVEHGSPHAIT